MKKILLIPKNYSINMAKILEKKISLKKKQNIIVTGGNTIKSIYKKINEKKINPKNSYFFSDERCLNKASTESNYHNLIYNLFKNKKNKYDVYRINAYEKNKKSVIKSYITNIPKKFELLILSLGDDGHLASIFKTKDKRLNSYYFYTNNKLFNRISIGKKILKRVKKTIILVKGKKRGKILNNYIHSKMTKKKIFPLFLFDNSSLYLDCAAFNELSKKYEYID